MKYEDIYSTATNNRLVITKPPAARSALPNVRPVTAESFLAQ
jgi:hypothetical protein